MRAELIHVACPLCGNRDGEFERELAGFTLQRCSSCRFVYTNPRPTDDELTRHYSGADGEQLIAHYSRVVTPSVLGQYRKTLEQIERVVPEKGRLLDLACAAGYFYEQAALRGWEAHGVDLGEWALEATRRRGLPNMHVGLLSEIGFPAHHFDVVHSAQMLEHLTDPSAILADIKRVLRPGGVLYVDVPNYHTLSIRLGRDDFWLNNPPEHLNYFTPKTLRRLLAQNGFTEIQLSTSGGMKWENILGGRIHRDVALGGSEGAATRTDGPQAGGSPRRSTKDRLRSVVKAAIVEPVFYKWLKSGMCLAAIARLP
jgi:SAM-dependent methyltransferase